MKISLFTILTGLQLYLCEEDVKFFFGCDRDVTSEYHKALQDFSTKLFKRVAVSQSDHFALSQYSIWLALSAIAEGSDGVNQKALFKALNLPTDSCLREKYYELATSLESPGKDVTLSRKRMLILDDTLTVNSTWMNAVRASGLVDTKVWSFESNDTAKAIRDLSGIDELNITGNSMLIDTLDYDGIWTTAFDNSSGAVADFFDDNGDIIGTVEMMKAKKRVKLGYIPLLNAKLLELSVGNNGRYRMLYVMNLGKTPIRRTVDHFPAAMIVDSMPLLVESLIPLEVAVPKLSVTSSLDLKAIVGEMGLQGVWDGGSNTYISDPPPVLASLTQRVSLEVSEAGLDSAPRSDGFSDLATGLASAVGRDFVANRPFIYGLLDSQTRTWLFSGVFSRP